MAKVINLRSIKNAKYEDLKKTAEEIKTMKSDGTIIDKLSLVMGINALLNNSKEEFNVLAEFLNDRKEFSPEQNSHIIESMLLVKREIIGLEEIYNENRFFFLPKIKPMFNEFDDVRKLDEYLKKNN